MGPQAQWRSQRPQLRVIFIHVFVFTDPKTNRFQKKPLLQNKIEMNIRLSNYRSMATLLASESTQAQC